MLHGLDEAPPPGCSAEVLALWHDRHGRPQQLDALVESWLLAPVTDSELLRRRRDIPATAPPTTGEAGATPLAWWVALPDERRWRRLQRLLQSDPAVDAAALRLHLTSPAWWTSGADVCDAPGVTPALAWLSLGDQRPAPPALADLVGTMIAELRSDDYLDVELALKAPPGTVLQAPRICDAAALGIMRNLFGLFGVQTAQRLARRHPRILVELQAATPAERDAAHAVLRRQLAPFAKARLASIGLTPPPDLAAVATDPEVVPGLTAAEAAACAAVLEQAVALGFPRLDGANVHGGDLVRNGGGTWWGPHLRLADGSWLADALVPLAAAQVRESGQTLQPGQPSGVPRCERLPEAAIARSEANWVLDGLRTDEAQTGMIALAWWRGGADPSCRAVLAAAVQAEVEDIDRGCPLVLDRMGHETQDRDEVVIPAPELAVRRICARWFADRLRLATGAEEIRRWGDAAERILASEDRVSWGIHLGRLRAAKALAEGPAGPALSARLAAWRGTGRDQLDGQWEGAAPPPPATLADLDALVALLGDTGPSRWWDGRVPRTLGDNALRCLAALTGVDWRWLVVDEPAVAARFASPLGAQVEPPWHVQRWTDAHRAACAAAIVGWWTAHRAAGAAGAVAATLRRMPAESWEDIFEQVPQTLLTDAVGDAIAAALQPPAGQALPAIGAIRGALLMPKHAGITAALATWPLGQALARLTAMRGQLAGTGAYDAAILDLLHGRFVPPQESFHGWRPERMLDPDCNLGLWMHQPTPARLQALAETLQRPLDQPGTLWLLAQVGISHHDVLGTWPFAERCFAGRPGRRAIPARLVELALADVRALTPAASTRLAELEGAGGGPTTWRNVAQPRVCDWAALQLMDGYRHLGLEFLPDGVDRPDTFRSADPAVRDRAIAALRRALAPVVADLLVEAGLAPAPPAKPAGGVDF